MDQRLIAWARAVKRRRRSRDPVLWLFTDETRRADPLRAAARLPKHLCGVVFRHDGAPDRAALGAALARLCRARGLALVVAGDARLAIALRAGVHLRAGRWPCGACGRAVLARRMVTSSAHSAREIARARQSGAKAIFLSPAFATASHPGAAGLGSLRWAQLARHAGGMAVLALGGITGRSARALPPACAGAGAIGALGG